MFKPLIIAVLSIVFIIGIIGAFSTSHAVDGVLDSQGDDLMNKKPENYPVATLAGGCFWCLESELRSLNGILYTRVGYTGGDLEAPTYQNITTGKTGHAEAVEITFDPEKITYEELVTFFLVKAHDPTQLNRQGVDVGTQYRSEIYTHTPEQQKIAQQLIKKINADNVYNSPIVTKISNAEKFWLAENYHQQYYEKWEEEKGEVHPRVFFKKKMKFLKGN